MNMKEELNKRMEALLAFCNENNIKFRVNAYFKISEDERLRFDWDYTEEKKYDGSGLAAFAADDR